MRRSEIQSKTGLTRKAIEYYEERGLLAPEKSENGYREYSEGDLKILIKISQLRKVGLTILEIEEYLNSGIYSLSSVLRRKQHRMEIEDRRNHVLEMILRGENEETIAKTLAVIEQEETIYEKLERAFPGYFGQMLFISYKPFLSETLKEEGKEAYDAYVKYLDHLPCFTLSDEEKKFMEEVSASFDLDALKEIEHQKRMSIEDPEKWWEENKDFVKLYEEMKRSKEYLETPMEAIKNKFAQFMEENRYFEEALPLLRKFSKSYDDYYIRLQKAGEIYKKQMEKTE